MYHKHLKTGCRREKFMMLRLLQILQNFMQVNIFKFGFFLLWNPLKLKWINFHGFSGHPLSIFKFGVFFSFGIVGN